jgi:hypothetical protein
VSVGSHTILTTGMLFVTTYFSFYVRWVSINLRLAIDDTRLDSSSVQTRLTLAGSAALSSLHVALPGLLTIRYSYTRAYLGYAVFLECLQCY